MGLGRMLRSAVVLTDGATFSSSDSVKFFNQSSTGLSASFEELASLTTVYRAINFLCNTQSILKLKAYRNANETPVRADVLSSPGVNMTFTGAEWRDYELRCRLTYGNSYSVKLGMTQTSPWPRHLAPIHPSRVRPYGVYKNGVLSSVIYAVTRPTVENIPIEGFPMEMDAVNDGRVMILDRQQMFHVPGQQFDGVTGVSPITACAMSLGIESATEKAAASFFGKGQLLSGFLKTDRRLDDDQAKKLKRRWVEKMAGIENAYEVAVLDSGLTFEPVSVKPEEAQFLEMRQFSVEQTARIFGVPPFLLMASGAGNAFGTGLEQQLTATDIFTLSYWLNALEERATMELLPGTQHALFDKSPLERADIKSLHAAFAIGRKNNYYSVNEIRERLKMPRLDDERADDPFEPVAAQSASEPGGNDGLQGGGSDADLGETDPAA